MDEVAFERLVASYRGELYAHCYRMLGSVQDAEDALQEALLGAWLGMAGFQGRSSLRTWLDRVTTNACLRREGVELAFVAALLGLLAEEARFTMAPLPAWFLGRQDVGRFLDKMFATSWRLLPIRANGQLALACYQGDPDGDRFRLGAINVVSLRAGRVVELAGFLDPGLHRHFGLPQELPER